MRPRSAANRWRPGLSPSRPACADALGHPTATTVHPDTLGRRGDGTWSSHSSGSDILAAGAIAYVAFRSWGARRRGEDGYKAGWRAVGEVLPVVGAGLAGLVLFLIIGFVLVSLLFLFALGAAMGGDIGGAGGVVAVLVLAALAALFGLPLAALLIVIAVRRRRHGSTA